MIGLQPLGLSVALAAAGLAAGWWLGAGHMQGRWDAAELQRERATSTLAAQEARRQNQAAAVYAAREQAIRAAAAALLPEVRHELQQPVPCVAGASAPQLGDLPVPAGVLDRLQRAGADSPAE